MYIHCTIVHSCTYIFFFSNENSNYMWNDYENVHWFAMKCSCIFSANFARAHTYSHCSFQFFFFCFFKEKRFWSPSLRISDWVIGICRIWFTSPEKRWSHDHLVATRSQCITTSGRFCWQFLCISISIKCCYRWEIIRFSQNIFGINYE